MRSILFLVLISCILIGTFSVSCVTEKPSEPEPAEEVVVPQSEPEPVKPEEPEPIPEPEPIIVEEEEPEDQVTEEEFVVTEDMYEKTFTDIETLIAELNAIIRDEEFETWTTYLSKTYQSSLEDPEELSRISEEPILKKYNIRLHTLKDYFMYVVVPSRSDARLDDIVFVDESRVKAIMIINNRRSILYKLEKIDDKWKIGDF